MNIQKKVNISDLCESECVWLTTTSPGTINNFIISDLITKVHQEEELIFYRTIKSHPEFLFLHFLILV